MNSNIREQNISSNKIAGRLRISIYVVFILLFLAQCAQGTPTPNPYADKILFESAVPGSGWELYTVDSDGTNVKQLTTLKNLIVRRAWSLDGQWIAFTIFPDGLSLRLVLNVMKADGTDQRQLSPDATGDVRWSPDNQQIAFVTKRDGMGEIYLINRDGSNEHRLTHGSTDIYANDVYDLSWSADGKQIAFIRPYQLYIVNADGSDEKALTDRQDTASAVAWSPDGKQIAFVMTKNQQSGIYTMLPDGSNLQKITDIPDSFTGLNWSPDGQHFDYSYKDNGNVSLFIVDADGNNNHQLATNVIGWSWSPDSKHIVYSSMVASMQSTMYIVDFDGKNQHVLHGNNASDESPLWSPAL